MYLDSGIINVGWASGTDSPSPFGMVATSATFRSGIRVARSAWEVPEQERWNTMKAIETMT